MECDECQKTKADLLTDFTDHLTALDRAPATVRGYRTDLSVFARWLERDLTTLTAADVREYRASQLRAGAAAQTVNRKLAAIAAFGSWAAQTGRLPANPAQAIKSVNAVPQAPKWLDKKERAAFLRAAQDDLQAARLRYPRLWVLRLRDAVAVTLLIHTGLRVSELCALQVGDLLLTERKAALTVRAGKGTKQRILPLNKDARQMLEQWLMVRVPSAGADLFLGQRGEPMQTRSVQLAVSRLAKLAGLNPAHLPPHLRQIPARQRRNAGTSRRPARPRKPRHHEIVRHPRRA